MIYLIISLMVIFVGTRLIIFIKNRRNKKSIDDIDSMFIKLINRLRN